MILISLKALRFLDTNISHNILVCLQALPVKWLVGLVWKLATWVQTLVELGFLEFKGMGYKMSKITIIDIS
jgi:hypothetical protein